MERRKKKNILVIATTSFPEPKEELRSPPSSFTSRNLNFDWHVQLFLLAGASCPACYSCALVMSKALILQAGDALAVHLGLGSGLTSLSSVMQTFP